MRKILTPILLACFAMPLFVLAQSKQKHYDFKQLQNNRYAGGVYPVWDSVAKFYKWYSPLKGNIDFSSHQPTTTTALSANTAQAFHLTKDINDETDGNPSNYQPQVYNQHYAVLNGVAYFTADDGIHGSELWRSDGTNAGSYIVKDVDPGLSSSGITNITAANGKIYFTATISANGSEPWVSDGTDAGTHILKDLSGYSYNEAPQMYTAVGNKVFFFLGNDQLWVTNGTDAGTKQISISSDNSNFQESVALGNKFFFTTYSYYYQRQLWCSDGTDVGTHMVKQIGFDFNDGPQQLTPYKNKLYFSADDGYGRKLWVSDGTDAGTYELVNNNAYLLSLYRPDPPMAIYNNALYFIGYDLIDNIGLQLYKYSFDSNDGVVLVKNITPGYDANIWPYEIVSYKNGVAFEIINYDGSATLWTTKGNDADTKILNTYSSGIGDLCNASGGLFFAAYSSTSGYELWRSNGTPSGTLLLNDIYPGISNSYPNFITSLTANSILLSAKNGSTGFELWKSDGTSTGTVIAKDINTSSSKSAITTSNIIANTTEGILFPAYTQDYGSELYYSDGTSTGTNLVSDIVPGMNESLIYGTKTINNDVYFVVLKDENGLAAIYKFQNTNKQLVRLFEAPSSDYGMLNNYSLADNGLLFFQMYNSGTNQREIWRTDGTSTGSFLLKTSPIYYYNISNEIVTVGNTAYFPGFDPIYGAELYRSDGTINRTKMVSDIYTGTNGSAPYSLINYNGTLFFGAQDDDGQYYFWKTNGTSTGTKKVSQIQPASAQSYLDTSNYKNNNVYCVSKGVLYISEHSYLRGNTLWVSNGTTAGTKVLKTINSNCNSSGINNLTDLNGTVYFSADDGVNGNELWSSNGTLVGTILIRDITAGSGGTTFSDFCVANNKLYFIANDALWSSTGPGNKTNPVSDAALQGLYSLNNLIASGNKLFFSGYSNQYGNEMYEGDVSTQAIASNAVAKNLTTALKGTVAPNPVSNVANVQLTNAKNADVILTDNTGRILWKQNNINTSQLQIPMQQYAAGVYYVKIISGKETITINIIKQD
jgi:ELWxxDGT repeat protein